MGGVESLGDADLLAIILGTGGGGAPLATLTGTLLEEHGGVGGLLRLGIGELAEHRGVGPAKAARLAAALELGRRAVQVAALEASPRLFDGAAVVAWARPRLATLDHEELWVLALDGRHGLRAARRVASGGIHGLHVGVRDVLRIVLKEAASAFVLVHNHPSGDPTPSDEDVAFTKAVTERAGTVGTALARPRRSWPASEPARCRTWGYCSSGAGVTREPHGRLRVWVRVTSSSGWRRRTRRSRHTAITGHARFRPVR